MKLYLIKKPSLDSVLISFKEKFEKNTHLPENQK